MPLFSRISPDLSIFGFFSQIFPNFLHIFPQIAQASSPNSFETTSVISKTCLTIYASINDDVLDFEDERLIKIIKTYLAQERKILLVK